jgi:hypothetical protein
LAHGVAGAIGALAILGGPRDLLHGAVRFVLAARRLDGHMPWGVGGAPPPGLARLAWCYGDAGTAVVLLRAADVLDDREVRTAGCELAALAARRAPEDAGVRDATLCHGAAGLVHLFGRLWQLTGDAACAQAARRWAGRALAADVPDRGLLFGGEGVALALFTAAGEIPPDWDRPLLLS